MKQAREVVREEEKAYDFAKQFAAMANEIGLASREVTIEEIRNKIALEEEYDKEIKRSGKIIPMTWDWKGRYTVIGLDQFDGTSWIAAKCEDKKKALAMATVWTEERKQGATSGSIATIFCAYSPGGQYIGGNTWR